MLRRLAPAILVAITSCRATPRASAPEAVAVPVTAPVLASPVTDLTGGWASGTGDAPQVPRITLHPSCTVIPAVWLIEQKGNDIRAWAFPEQYNQGIARPNTQARIAPATGTISGAEVVLDDGTYRYVLTFDTATTQLRGTRNGVPFWAIRQQVVREGFCLPPPT